MVGLAGASCYVMNRDNRRGLIFLDYVDRHDFSKTLAGLNTKRPGPFHDWRCCQ